MFQTINLILKNRRKVLGMNERNLEYIRKHNKKKYIEIADNKILTKEVLAKTGIPTPKLITVIKSYQDLINFDFNNLPSSFVLKPVSGLEGGGIDLFYNQDKNGQWIRADKTKASISDLKKQIIDILDGKFSLNQIPDSALFEERIRTHKVFKYYTYKGAPDIRVIVFNGVPVMAFLRIPTLASRGKANLALGAIATGIDMANGITTFAIQGKAGYIEKVPGTKLPLSGLKIPYWEKILRYSIEAQKAVNLNYLAVDFLIDRDIGPVIVELNARPGLSIELANKDGLRWRLKKVRDVKVNSVEKGIKLAKYLFGGEIENEIESISGKDVIGIYENVSLINEKGEEIKTIAKIDTGADSTSIDKKYAENLGYKEILNEYYNENIPEDFNREEGLKIEKTLKEKYLKKYPDKIVDVQYIKSSHGNSVRPYIKIQLKLKDTIFETNANIVDRTKLKYSVIIGRKSLSKFLIDPAKTLPLSK